MQFSSQVKKNMNIDEPEVTSQIENTPDKPVILQL